MSITLNPLIFGLATSAIPRVAAVWRASRRGEPRRRRAPDARSRANWAASKSEPPPLGLQPDQLMKKFPVFADSTAAQRAELLTLFKPRSAAPGERVIRAGDIGTEMFFISSGAVEVSIGGRRIPLGPGDFFGEMALITGGAQPPM